MIEPISWDVYWPDSVMNRYRNDCHFLGCVSRHGGPALWGCMYVQLLIGGSALAKAFDCLEIAGGGELGQDDLAG